MLKPHPCLSCGACCAYFRVSFYWAEPVPSEYTEKLNDFYVCMKGTNEAKNNRCVALTGVVGAQVSCSIYEQRSSGCREFQASYENGFRNPRCDEARIHKGIPVLEPKDWTNP